MKTKKGYIFDPRKGYIKLKPKPVKVTKINKKKLKK